MNTDKIHIRELIGRCVEEVFMGERIPSTSPPDRRYFTARGWVLFKDGLLVELAGAMELAMETMDSLPRGSVVVPAQPYAPRERWRGSEVTDVGCSPWYASYCLHLACGMVIGLREDEYTMPEIGPLDVDEQLVWLVGPSPDLPDWVREWWTGPYAGRDITKAAAAAAATCQ